MMIMDLSELERNFNLNKRTGELRWKTARSRKAKAGGPAGSVDGNGYRQVRLHGKMYKVHQIVWLMSGRPWLAPGRCVDHIDRNKLNNAPANLREVSHRQNHMNRSDGAKYHHLTKAYSKWVVQIYLPEPLGAWRSKSLPLEEAILERDRMLKKHLPECLDFK